MATFFLRIQGHFVNSFNKIFWEPLKITSQKSPKTSDSWNPDILPIPISIPTETCPFELKYKGRRTRNTQVCRHKITAYVYLSYMSSCARPISEKLVFEPFLKSGFSSHSWKVAFRIFLGINIRNNILAYFGPRWSPEVPDVPQRSPKPITSCGRFPQPITSCGQLADNFLRPVNP